MSYNHHPGACILTINNSQILQFLIEKRSVRSVRSVPDESLVSKIKQAYRYLDRFKGIDFVDEFYGVEHTQSFEDVVDDLTQYCHKNGGALI